MYQKYSKVFYQKSEVTLALDNYYTRFVIT